jgi:Cu(I)/Ag(I) efflux system membrane protein CusA/SilA
MIEKIIEYSVRNRFILLFFFILLIGWGVWALYRTPVDAIPDLSENQVIVMTEWMGRSPKTIEDQVTYPLSSNLQGLPKVKAVRGLSMFGLSMIYVIFEDGVDVYWARSRVLEKLNYAQSFMPEGVTSTIGPDGTGVGHVYWYTVEGDGYDLGELRAIQDWYIRYQLNSVSGVAEVASIGGFVKQYQIDLDPNKLLSYHLTIPQVMMATQKANNEVGGSLIEASDMEYFIRGQGYVKSKADLENIVVGKDMDGVPIYVKNIGVVQLGGEPRRGLMDKNGEGEVVGGIIVMRYGENAKDVIQRVKTKIKEIEPGLPPGVKIETAYDRSDLILRAIGTLKEALLQEIIIVCLVALLFLFHFRSALTVMITLPIAVLISFIFMKHLGITSNIMSLGGVALAIGELVDSSIVMVENAYRHMVDKGPKTRSQRTEIVISSCKQVGRAIFFSMIIMILSFLPIFLLQEQEGKLFKPLAFTKTFAMIGASCLSITLVPVLMSFFMGGRMRTEQENPVTRFLNRIYTPIIHWVLKHKKTTLGLNLLALLVTIPLLFFIGREFMPPLDEGSLLFMPVTLPSVSITEAKRIMQVQDKIIKSLPEVDYVLGKVGRAETATDPAPVDMIETIILLKPKNQWRKGISKNDIISELDAKLQIPGVSNGWTQPIINRINMLTTGIRTDLGIKIFGPDLDTLAHLAVEVDKILRPIPGAVDLYAERVTGGKYLDIDIDREKIARYGINMGDVQEIIETGIGGENVSTTVEGRRRFPIRIRLLRDYRDDWEALQRVLVPTMDGSQIPLGQVADLKINTGPTMINSENSMLRSVVLLNVRGRDMGRFVSEAKSALDKNLKMPTGYYISWSGQYENQIRMQKRLAVLFPVVLLIIFILLYFTFHSFGEALLVIASTLLFSLIGGVWLFFLLGANFSAAVGVGFISLFGTAVQTGVLMVVYLHEALDKKLEKGNIEREDITQATIDGSVLRLRPKLMTVSTTMIGLMPLMWATGTGSDVMRPIAAPIIGGMVTSTIHVLIATPVIFALVKEHLWKKGKLKPSRMANI